MTSDQLPVVPEGVSSIDIIDVQHGAFGIQGSGDTSGLDGSTAGLLDFLRR